MPFWESLRDVVAPAGRLRRLYVCEGSPSESDVEPLARLAGSLEELVLWTTDDLEPATAGIPRFPESLCALTELRILALRGHPRITAIPAGISSLKKLKELDLTGCDLSSLPKELGELSGLEVLNLSFNNNLGGTLSVGEAFPAELGNMKSLKNLYLNRCGLRTVPPFVGELKSLQLLGLFNGEAICASLDFLIKGCPRLCEVWLHGTVPGRPYRPPRWTRATRARVEAFKAKLRTRNPNAKVIC